MNPRTERMFDMRISRKWRVAALAVAVVAIMGSVLAALPVRAATEAVVSTVATLIRNQDEPTRNSYQQLAGLSNGSCSSGPCYYEFSTVPSGKKLHVTHVSCYFLLTDTGGLNSIYLSGGSPTALIFLVATAQGNGKYFVVDTPTDLYVTSGNTPTIDVDLNTSSLSSSSGCTIVGYEINA